MVASAGERIEGFLSQCRLYEAAVAATQWRSENARDFSPIRRLCAAVYALSGNDRELAAVCEPELLACRTHAAADAYLDARGVGAGSFDRLAAAAVLAWYGDANGTYALLREAHDAANSEHRYYLAAAARERLAHHALLFGDVELAHSALGDAIEIASSRELAGWTLRSLAFAARLAFDAGDRERAAALLDRGRSVSSSPESLALLAPAGAALATAAGDDGALLVWAPPEIIQTALHSELPEVVAAATIAALVGARVSPPLEAHLAVALRRALLIADGVANAVELFSLAARYGEPDEARLGVNALRTVFTPKRAYLRAHYLLSRAYLLFRFGEGSAWIDHAGDAARAFNAITMRRWTDDAMLLLVRQEGESDRQQRRRRPTTSSLTGREQQVAHLIRRGARNREVAHALQISEHTVERHVSSILGRLGLRSRWQIVDPKKGDEH